MPSNTYDVHILNVATGETRIHVDPWHDMYEYEPGGQFRSFMWEEGNYSCDCNRHLFFERAVGNEPDWDTNLRCNTSKTDRKYRVVKITVTGDDEVLYADD